MRLILLIAVAALFVDALYFSGAYTQHAFRQVTVATEQLADSLGDGFGLGGAREASEPLRL